MFTLYPLQTDETSRYGLDWEKGSLSEKVACLVSGKRVKEVSNAGENGRSPSIDQSGQ